jgi:hypothetical protein
MVNHGISIHLTVLLSFVGAHLSGIAYSQASGLVQPLVSPLPSPGVAAPAAAPAAAAGGNNPGGTSGAGSSSGVNRVSGTGDLQANSLHSSTNPAELERWIEESLGKVSLIPNRVAFVIDLPKKGVPQFLLFDAKKFNQLGFFQASNAAAIAWDLKLNKRAFTNREGFDVAVTLSRADLIVLSPKVGDWSVFLAKGDRKKPVAKGAPPIGAKEEDLAGWLTSILGWDGVVLEQRGHQLLVGSTLKILSQPQLQALAVDGSASKFGLNENERKGSGLLSLVYSKSGIGVFDIVFLGQGVKEIPAGTKLVIEKK